LLLHGSKIAIVILTNKATSDRFLTIGFAERIGHRRVEPGLRLRLWVMDMWDAFNYSEVFGGRFSAEECERIIALYQETGMLQSRMPRGDSSFIRDSDLFWVPRTPDTDWSAFGKSPHSTIRGMGSGFPGR